MLHDPICLSLSVGFFVLYTHKPTHWSQSTLCTRESVHHLQSSNSRFHMVRILNTAATGSAV